MSAEPATSLKAESAAEAAQLFVINLCASTSPMALTHPNTPELKRFTFFVSRQREDGRERFRLHMGYFGSQEEAELLLTAVRDVYPAAWAGPAPTSGVPRRARISAAPTVTVTPQAAAPTAVVTAASPAPAPAHAVAAAPVPASPPAQNPVAAGSEALEAMSNVRDVLARLSDEPPATTVAAPVAPPAPEANSQPKPVAAARAAAPAPAPAPARSPAPELDASQTLRVLESAAPTPTPTPTPAPAVESRPAMPAAARAAARGRPPAPPSGEGEVRIVTPEDTQTLTDIRLDAQNNAPPCFAVQLVWAVTPIDVANLPHLAIFDAYTLYNVEGSRQGRKWFGLRLGFFSDPHSATQVAHYVRSDYPAVAVVPVATRERDHAKGGTAVTAPAAGSSAPLRPENSLAIEKQALDGFELLPDDVPRAAKRDVDDITPQQPAAGAPVLSPSSMTAREKISAAAAGKPLVKPTAPAAAVASAAGKPPGKPAGKRVVVRKRPQPGVRTAPGAPNPLESTLEILGASTLTLDESREIVNDSAIRKPIDKKSGSRFSKLLSRLSGG